MVSRKIVEYIEDKLKENVSEEKIILKLKSAKISQASINAALNKVRKERESKVKTKEKKPAPTTQKKQIQEKIEKGRTKEENITRILLLKKYITYLISRNISKETVAGILLNAGWKKEHIDSIFKEIGEKIEIKEMPKEKEIELKIDEKEIKNNRRIKVLEEYIFRFMEMNVKVIVYSEREKPTTFYHMIIPGISETTDLILEEIRLKLIDQINLGALEIAEGGLDKLDKDVRNHLVWLVADSFPHVDENTQKFLVSYLIAKVLGLGRLEIIRTDDGLEEIVINESSKPIYVYHKKWGWCRTNQYVKDDKQIMHLAAMIGRGIGREITTLAPLLDAHLPSGDRVNATLKPITINSPTITIRKFSTDPWTITKFLKTKTIDYNIASLMWLAIQYELSILVVGGTASGKTSCLNVLSNLIPPNQRIISIEDTREIRLPKYMHWVPMVVREANAEGKGGIEMENLLVNSLRMRPDRIIVGEVRKREQAETLFEAIHTGHSCYATFHANNAEEAIVRLTNPPVSVPKTMLPAISMLLVQYRNRRTGLRRTFQIAEITKKGDANVLYQYNPRTDNMAAVNKSTTLFNTLELFTGNTTQELNQIMKGKIKVLKYLTSNNLDSIEQVGKIMALYYTEYDYLMDDIIAKNKRL
ncbi:MAG: CpaF family protein [Nanoarchaeota archaeon]|nr:CpaF family protein [Nanoarchaeota archaeon]